MQQEASDTRHRPLGVTIIAVILSIESILELLGGVLILVGIFAIGRTISGHGHTTTGHVVDVVNVQDVLFKAGQFRTYSDDVTQSAPTNSPRK